MYRKIRVLEKANTERHYCFFYTKLLNKKGHLHKANSFFRETFLKFKLKLSSNMNLRNVFPLACVKAAPPFYLRKLTLGGLEYKVPWALFERNRTLKNSAFVLHTAKRKGSSKKDKIASMLFEALFDQGEAVSRKNEMFKIGRENRGLVYFIRK